MGSVEQTGSPLLRQIATDHKTQCLLHHSPDRVPR